MTYRSELIQTAAACLAAVQSFDTKTTTLEHRGYEYAIKLTNEVLAERVKQETKWGPQNHKPEKWLTIIVEEVGEVAKDILEKNY